MIGLENLGNTCYMNAAIQCLLATQPLREYFSSSEYKRDLVTNSDAFRNTLTYALRSLFRLHNVTVRPVTFKSCLGALMPAFSGHAQNDSQECLSFIIDRVHEETLYDARVAEPTDVDLLAMVELITQTKDQRLLADCINNNYSLYVRALAYMYLRRHLRTHSAIRDMFEGLTMNVIRCMRCNHPSITFEPFSLLPLPISHSNVQSCLYSLFEDTMLDDYECAACKKKRRAIKLTSIVHAPKQLIISLKRFGNDAHITNTTDIDFPVTNLDLTMHMTDLSRASHVIYDLYAIIYHVGSVHGGHYYACTKYDDQWILFDDDRIMRIEEHSLVTRNAYVLLYRRLPV